MPRNTLTRQVNNNGLFDFSIPSYEKSAGAVPVTRPALQGVSHCPLQ